MAYFPDGFPIDPREALNFTKSLTPDEKTEYSEWLNTATEAEKKEFVDLLHSMYIQDTQAQFQASGLPPQTGSNSGGSPSSTYQAGNNPTQNFQQGGISQINQSQAGQGQPVQGQNPFGPNQPNPNQASTGDFGNFPQNFTEPSFGMNDSRDQFGQQFGQPSDQQFGQGYNQGYSQESSKGFGQGGQSFGQEPGSQFGSQAGAQMDPQIGQQPGSNFGSAGPIPSSFSNQGGINNQFGGRQGMNTDFGSSFDNSFGNTGGGINSTSVRNNNSTSGFGNNSGSSESFGQGGFGQSSMGGSSINSEQPLGGDMRGGMRGGYGENGDGFGNSRFDGGYDNNFGSNSSQSQSEQNLEFGINQGGNQPNFGGGETDFTHLENSYQNPYQPAFEGDNISSQPAQNNFAEFGSTSETLGFSSSKQADFGGSNFDGLGFGSSDFGSSGFGERPSGNSNSQINADFESSFSFGAVPNQSSFEADFNSQTNQFLSGEGSNFGNNLNDNNLNSNLNNSSSSSYPGQHQDPYQDPYLQSPQPNISQNQPTQQYQAGSNNPFDPKQKKEFVNGESLKLLSQESEEKAPSEASFENLMNSRYSPNPLLDGLDDGYGADQSKNQYDNFDNMLENAANINFEDAYFDSGLANAQASQEIMPETIENSLRENATRESAVQGYAFENNQNRNQDKGGSKNNSKSGKNKKSKNSNNQNLNSYSDSTPNNLGNSLDNNLDSNSSDGFEEDFSKEQEAINQALNRPQNKKSGNKFFERTDEINQIDDMDSQSKSTKPKPKKNLYTNTQEIQEIYNNFVNTHQKAIELEEESKEKKITLEKEFREKQSNLLGKMMEVIENYEEIAEKMIDLNANIINQDQRLIGLENGTGIKGGQSVGTSLITRVRNLEKKISNLVEDFNSFADDVYGKIETLEKQVSAALTDSYGDQGLLTKVDILSERIRKFEEELRYAPKVIARNDDF